MPLYQYTILYTCSNCYWWCVRESWDILEYGGEYDYVITGIAKKWNLSDRNIPISILKDYLIKNKKKSNFGVIDSFVFEKLIAECLKYEYRPCEVHHVGARGGKGDEGIDIYLIKDDIEWLIQVKRRIKECSEPVDTIRLLNGVLLRKGKQHGMVITSANSFTRNAKAETAIQTPGAYCVELIDRGDILKMLSKAHEGKEPWQRALDDPDVYYRELPLSEEFASLFVK